MSMIDVIAVHAYRFANVVVVVVIVDVDVVVVLLNNGCCCYRFWAAAPKG